MKIADIQIPDIGWMDAVKCLTRSGRQELVRKIAKPFSNSLNLASLAATGIAKAVNVGTDQLTDERCTQIAEGCKALETCFALAGKAVTPRGDGGKTVTDAERAEIATAMGRGIGELVTQDSLDAILDELVKKVP